MNTNLLTVDELAEKLRVKKSWVYGQTRQTGIRSIPKIRVGKYIRFIEADVMSWLKQLQEEG